MSKTAEAVSHGAITIVNAIATGQGAALGVKLWTKARVTLTNKPGSFTGRNLTDPNEDTTLIETTADRVFRRFDANRQFGARVETVSNIPIAVGLKSSSAASNAVALASLKALGKKTTDREAVKLGVDASLQSGVTLTGAYDDACACYFGGIVVTDNVRRRILKRFSPKGRLRVLIHVPNQKKYTKDVNPKRLKRIRSLIRQAHDLALKGNYWQALTLNGLAYSRSLGYDTTPVGKALSAGAIAAGLSGKGPAIAAVVPFSRVAEILSAWDSLSGKIIETSPNFEKAHTVRVVR